MGRSRERERINQKVRCIRVSNDRYAKETTFEDRLTIEIASC